MNIPVELPPAEAKRFDLVGFGENSIDLVASLPGLPRLDWKMPLSAYLELPGGIAATAVMACARLGWRTRYVGTFGKGRHADQIESALLAEGVDVSAVRRTNATNRLAIVLVDVPTGARTVLERRDPNLDWPPAQMNLNAMTSGRVLLVDSTDVPAATVAAKAAHERGIVTVVDAERADAGMEAVLQEIDVIITAEAFPGAYTGRPGVGEGLQQLVDEFKPALAVVTLGREGSLAICQGREVRTPAFRVPVMDTTGAGDAFRGGFVAGLLEFGPESVERLLEYANAVAACNCRAFGAQNGLPTKADVDALVTGNGRAWSN